jgi:hypothetical protein
MKDAAFSLRSSGFCRALSSTNTVGLEPWVTQPVIVMSLLAAGCCGVAGVCGGVVL